MKPITAKDVATAAGVPRAFAHVQRVASEATRLVCPLDHRPCDHGCPSCRGDYAVQLRRKQTREERMQEAKR